jgi:methionine biosynthesis protein MetW
MFGRFEGARLPDFRGIRALDYDDYWKKRGFSVSGKLKQRERIFLEWIPKGARVLDVGCGNSRLPLVLKEKGCDVQVADVSALVLEGYRALGIGAVRLDLDRVAEAKLDGTYDVIVMSEVLEHTRNPEEIVARLSPHARRFALSIPNSAFYRYRLHLMFAGRFFTQWVHHPSEHLRYWSHLDFMDWLPAMGLEVEKIAASNGLLDRTGLKDAWPNLFGHQICYLARVP